MSGIPCDCSGALTIERYGRFWAVYDGNPSDSKQDGVGQLVCLTVYRKGAREVVRRLKATVPPAEEHHSGKSLGDDDMKGTRDDGICQRADNRPGPDGLYGR